MHILTIPEHTLISGYGINNVNILQIKSLYLLKKLEHGK